MVYKSSKYTRLYLLLAILTLCSVIPLQAQNYVFRHMTTRSGLAGGYVNQIEQDDKGFIWFATSTGLSKYDGYNFANFRPDGDVQNAVRSENITRILLLDGNEILVGHGSGLDLMRVDDGTFQYIDFTSNSDLPPLELVWDMILDDNGDLWVSSSNRLYHFNDPDFSSGTLQGNVHTLQNEDEEFVIRTLEKYEDEIWAGTSNGVYVFNPETAVFREINAVSTQAGQVLKNEIWELLTGPDGHLYISAFNGLLRWNTQQNQIEYLTEIASYTPEEIFASGFQDMMIDSEGHLWLGGSALGAVRWNLQTNEFTEFRSESDNLNTVNSSDIHYIFEDDQNNIWFGYHFLGASIMYSQTWNYLVSRPFPELPMTDPMNTIHSAAMDEQGVIWATGAAGVIRDLGSENQGLIPFDPSVFELPEGFTNLGQILAVTDEKIFTYAMNQGVANPLYVVLEKNKPENPFSIIGIPDSLELIPGAGTINENVIYEGTFSDNAILRINIETGETEVIKIPSLEDYPQAALSVSSAFFIRDKDLYVQTYNLGLPSGAIVERFIMNLDTGEFREHEITVDYPISGIQAPLTSTYEEGVKYINSNTGLIRVDNFNNTYSVLFEDQISFLREGALLMTEDQDGYIWLTNLTGLIRIDPLTESLDYYEIPREQFTPLFAIPAALHNGEIIFPGNGSYVRFNPAELSSNQPSGEPVITSLKAGTEIFELVYNAVEPEIENSQNTLTFNFIGLDYREPASVNYRYRIVGSENEQWTRIGNQRTVFIPSLPAGNYTFEVQSGSQFGTFNEQTASLSFSILPPWWNTIPAYISYLFFFGLMVFLTDRLQRKRLINKERERAREKELEQAKEIEKAYENLKAAQNQLVQQEKLASLGQLTAGIAHEIKNPLNFVNNFSELSVELIEEAREEVKEKMPADSHELTAILDDIETNLRKIHEHGSRADSIVKSMLQHSRGGSGNMEPTDLNALVKEYVNLAFHGMRAAKNPINVDISLELDDDLGEVALISEDFSRVIVNLCNNAFDAMREKLTGDGGPETGYEPRLSIRTIKKDSTVAIEIEDNGPGIPDEMKDKILQPFFTTKKGTQGTGLGLSITNDIIKAHGGTLQILSERDQFTKFIITLTLK